MKIQLHEKARERFDELAVELVGYVQQQPGRAVPLGRPGFDPDIATAGTLDPTIIHDPTMSTTDGRQVENARFFSTPEHVFMGLADEGYRKFRDLVSRVVRCREIGRRRAQPPPTSALQEPPARAVLDLRTVPPAGPAASYILHGLE